MLSMVTVGANMVDPAFDGIFPTLVILWVVPPPSNKVLMVDPMAFVDTLPKFNIAPEKLPSQKESNLPTIIFQGPC